MSRRASLPGADELFRVTGPQPPPTTDLPATELPATELPATDQPAAVPAPPALTPGREQLASVAPSRVAPSGRESRDAAAHPSVGQEHTDLVVSPLRRSVAVSRRPRPDQPTVDARSSGRERHEEKITVYVSPEELFDIEHARLVLRGEHGIASDRGRIVREAVAVVLADFEAKGQQSILVRRLGGR